MARVVKVDRAMGLRQPQSHLVKLKQSSQTQELVGIESAFVLADHDRVELPPWIGDRRE
jgi:hypothetical protein